MPCVNGWIRVQSKRVELRKIKNKKGKDLKVYMKAKTLFSGLPLCSWSLDRLFCETRDDNGRREENENCDLCN